MPQQPNIEALAKKWGAVTAPSAPPPGADIEALAKKYGAIGAAPSSPYDALIDKYSAEFDVDRSFVLAVLDKGERNTVLKWNPKAVSPAGAQGIAQLMPATAKALGVTDPFDPEQSIKGGVQLLKSLLVKYDGDETLAAAAYNAGEGAVARHNGVPPYKETQAYVGRVMEGRGGTAAPPATPEPTAPAAVSNTPAPAPAKPTGLTARSIAIGGGVAPDLSTGIVTKAGVIQPVPMGQHPFDPLAAGVVAGMPQMARGVTGGIKAAVAQDPKMAANALSDLAEGSMRVGSPLLITALAANPLVAAPMLALATLASDQAVKFAAKAGWAPEYQRLAGNAAALAVLGVGGRRIAKGMKGVETMAGDVGTRIGKRVAETRIKAEAAKPKPLEAEVPIETTGTWEPAGDTRIGPEPAAPSPAGPPQTPPPTPPVAPASVAPVPPVVPPTSPPVRSWPPVASDHALPAVPEPGLALGVNIPEGAFASPDAGLAALKAAAAELGSVKHPAVVQFVQRRYERLLAAYRHQFGNEAADAALAEITGGKNAVQEPGAASVDARQPPENGRAVGEGNAQGSPPGARQEVAPAEAQGEVAPIESAKAGSVVADIPVADIHTDAPRFQYKLDTSAEGIRAGDQIREDVWDVYKGGQTLVWRDPADGKIYVVNGHHRLAHAKRVGQPNITVRFIDVPDAKSARIVGAEVNISEGRGTAIDAAKLMRDQRLSGEQLDALASRLSTQVGQDGLALARLSDPTFAKVATGQMPLARALAVGRANLSPEEESALLTLLAKREKGGTRLREGVVEQLAHVVKDAGTVEVTGTGPQRTIFDALGDETWVNLAVHKADLSAWLIEFAAKDKRLYKFVAKGDRPEDLARAGNVINVEGSLRAAHEAEIIQTVVDKLIHAKGPINDAITAAATDIAKGGSVAAARQSLIESVRRAVKQELGGAAEGMGDGAGFGIGHAEQGNAAPEVNAEKPSTLSKSEQARETFKARKKRSKK